MDNFKYKVSVIMAVYNVEAFLRESIDSLIAQDIGFENIQLILVDDGSPDGSGAICDEYAAKYPENIVVIHKENGGVSSARNMGLERVEGRFVNFLDSDDKLTPETVGNVYRFFMDHLDETDVVAFPMEFFDGQTGSHILNTKFSKGSRVIDLDRDWQNPQLSMSSAFVKAECLAPHRFDSRLAYAEDAQIMQRLLADKFTMGVVQDAAYLYRRRSDGQQSAIQSSVSRKAWYLSYMRYFQLETIQFYLDRYGFVPRFIQATLMYDLQWRVKLEEIPDGVLTEAEEAEYLALLHQVLGYIDDDVIDAQKHIFREHKLLAYQLKHGDTLTLCRRSNEVLLRSGDRVRFRASDLPLKLEFLDLSGGTCTIDGVFGVLPFISEPFTLTAQAAGRQYECELLPARRPARAMGREIQQRYPFRVTIPLDQAQDISFRCRVGDSVIPLRLIQYGSFFPVSTSYSSSYYAGKGWLVLPQATGIHLEPFQPKLRGSYERKFRRELWKKQRPGARKAVLFRLCAGFLRKLKRKPLWLISDRVMKAGDNGEALFRYLRENHPEIDARFVISGSSPDYAMMKQVGPVLKRDSYFYKICLLLSDRVISSSAEVETYNPFHGYSEPYRDILTDTKFIFLQHGVTKDDLSQWLGRFNKNLSGFVTAAKPEWDSVVHGAYEYTEKEVWLTGFPRFDRLYRDEQRWITIMPTWRKYLMGGFDPRTDQWSLAPDAENSEYVRFYNRLLNDPRLRDAAKRFGYKLMFLPHPNFQTHLDIFEQNDDVTFLGREMNYRDIYARSELILTDYSSVVFDFAYLRKPVVYTHFDAEDFFAGEHVYSKGYFDYERDGFGEVEYTLDATVDRLIEYMEKGCPLKDEYRRRIDGFFAFDDQNNCQRVYEKIMEMEDHV